MVPGALQAGDQDDRAEVNVVDLGMPLEQILDPQPVHQCPDEPCLLYLAAGGSQAGFVVDRGDKHIESTQVAAVAEVLKAGLAPCGIEQ